jgi:hypothetical protein
LVEKPEGKRLLRRPRWEDNIKLDLRETVEECGLDSTGSGDRDHWRLSTKGGEFLDS